MIYFKAEQFKIMQGLYYLKNFIGKGKDENNLDNVIQMKVENAKLIFEANNKNVFGEIEIGALAVQDDGILPYVEVNTLIDILADVGGTSEVEIYSQDNMNLYIMFPGRYEKVNGVNVPNPFILVGATVSFVSSPTLKEIKANYDIDGASLKEGIAKACEIITPGDPVKGCVCMNIKTNAVLFECMNSKDNTLMVYGFPYKAAQEYRFFFDGTKSKYILNQFSDDDVVNVQVSENFILFTQSNRYAYLQLSAGSYPNVLGFMPQQFKYTYEVSKGEILPSLKRASTLLKKSVIKSCTLELQHMDGRINIANQRGKNKELFLVNGSQELTKKTFNVETLIKLLLTFEDDSVLFCIYDNGGVICMPKTNQYIHRILMPRLADKE